MRVATLVLVSVMGCDGWSPMEPDAVADDAGSADGGPALHEDAGGDARRADGGAGELDAGSVDAGVVDAGRVADAGVVDAGRVVDAGVVDAGRVVDAGAEDAGRVVDGGAMDAGVVDAGRVDAGFVDAGRIDAGSFDAGSFDAGSFDAGVVDRQPPSQPTGLVARVESLVAVALTWQPATDDVGVAQYRITRNARVLGTSPSAAFVDGSPPVSTTLTYSVQAVDAAGNVSSASMMATAYLVDVKRFGARGDGATDDTAAFASALSACPPGCSIVVPQSSGAYLINATRQGSYGLMLKNDVTVVSAGTLRVIPNAADSYALFRCVLSNGITFTGGVYEGDRTQHTASTGQWGHLLSFLGCSNVTIRNATFRNAWGDGLYLGAPGNYTPNSGFVIADNVIDANRRNGISVTIADGLLIKDNVITNTGPGSTPHTGTPTLSDGPYYGIDFEPNNANETIRNATIDGNEFAGNEGGGMQLGIPGSISGAAPFVKIVVANNDVHDNGSIGQGAVYISKATGITARRNTVTRNARYGFFVVGGSNGNVFEDNGQQPNQRRQRGQQSGCLDLPVAPQRVSQQHGTRQSPVRLLSQ